MSQNVEENDLDFRRFRCCGDEDLYPFRCPRCGRLMVFCYECDTLHGDLNDSFHIVAVLTPFVVEVRRSSSRKELSGIFNSVSRS